MPTQPEWFPQWEQNLSDSAECSTLSQEAKDL